MARTDGIEVRHQRGCGTRDGRPCSCRPAYRASVWDPRDRRLIRKSFATRAAAKGWRVDALAAIRRGELRGDQGPTLREAAAAWEDGRLRPPAARAAASEASRLDHVEKTRNEPATSQATSPVGWLVAPGATARTAWLGCSSRWGASLAPGAFGLLIVISHFEFGGLAGSA
jgi:hypothetical protein